VDFAPVLDGFGVVLEPVNLLYCLIGVVVGMLVGVLPGLGPGRQPIASCCRSPAGSMR
jgi:putative tricarboxylic transport membrane protein